MYLVQVLVILIVSNACCEAKVEEIYSWNYVEYENLPKPRDSFITPDEPYYIPGNTNAEGIAYQASTGLFIVTVAREKRGVPSSVNAFCAETYSKGSNTPAVWGFPNYRINELKAEYFETSRSNRSMNYELLDGNMESGKIDVNVEEKEVKEAGIKEKDTEEKSDSQITEKEGVAKAELEDGPEIKEKTYSYTSVPAKETIISVYHPVIDDVCNRLWLLDGGQLNYQDGNIKIFQSAIWIIDIPRVPCGTGFYNIRRRFELTSIDTNGGGFSTIALDYKKGGTCDDVFGYFPDIFEGRINVYDYKKNKAWSFQNHYSFVPVVSSSTFELKGEEFTEEFGLFSITLGWRDKRGIRTAYYMSPTSTVQFGVSTDVLKNEKLAPLNYNQDVFYPIGNRGCDTNALVHVFDARNGVIFYGDRDMLSIRCWNVKKPPTPDYIDVIYQDPNFAYIQELFIDEQGFLWALSNINPYFSKYGFNVSEVNIRLVKIHADDAIKDTLCDNNGFYVKQ